MKGHKAVAGAALKAVSESKPRVRAGADPVGVAVDRLLTSWDLAVKALNGLTGDPEVGGEDRETILGVLGAYVALGPRVAHRLESLLPESAQGKIDARGMAIHEEITDDAWEFAIEGESMIADIRARLDGDHPFRSVTDGPSIMDILAGMEGGESDPDQSRADAACKGGCPAPSLDRV